MRRFFVTIHIVLSHLDRKMVAAAGLLLVVLLGWLDYLTGFELSFSFFYLFPIALVTWYMDLGSGQIISVLSILTWLISNWHAGAPYSHEAIRYFNAGIRLTVFFLVAALLNELKRYIEHESILARTDPLTGILNVREFYTQAELEFKRSSRNKQPLSMVYFDLDNFKQVNDKQGHSAGDELLKTIVMLIAAIIRKTDLFARLGGDEFVLLLPNVDQKSAKCVMRKLEESILTRLRTIHSPVTFSAGVVTFVYLPKTVDEAIRQADALMYQAKLTGKNQTLYAQGEPLS